MISSHAYNVISKSYSLKFLLKVTKAGGNSVTFRDSMTFWVTPGALSVLDLLAAG